METQSSNAYLSVLISFAIVEKDGKYLCVLERDGWYFPAGRVDFGESFPTGAIREALEESGVPVKLEGLLKLQHTPGLKNSRFRAFFKASPIDDTPPRSEANHEIVLAKWLSIDEVRNIPKRELRSPELVTILEFVSNGATVYPLSILDGIDAPSVDHALVRIKVEHRVVVIVSDGSNSKFLLKKNDAGEYVLPNSVMQKPIKFVTEASRVVNGISPYGIINIEHIAPTSEESESIMTVTFAAKPINDSVIADGIKSGELKWESLDVIESSGVLTAKHLAFIKNFGKLYIAPLELIQMEYEQWS